MNKIRKLVKRVLSEFHGEEMILTELSKNLTDEVINQINLNLNKISDGGVWKLISYLKMNDDVKSKIGFNTILINIDYKKDIKYKFSGSFKTDKTKLLDDGNYEITIDLVLHIDEFSLENNNRIKYVIVHELNHAFVDIKNIKGNRRSTTLNKANKSTKYIFSQYFNDYPELKLFSELVYLSNPYEVQARVQETANQIADSKKNTAEDTLEHLLRFQPINDAKKMISYSSDELKRVDEKILREFILSFNKNIELNNVGNSITTFDNVEKFINYWTHIINTSGDKLIRKIYKLVSDKFTLNEGVLFISSIGEDVYKWVYGKNIND